MRSLQWTVDTVKVQGWCEQLITVTLGTVTMCWGTRLLGLHSITVCQLTGKLLHESPASTAGRLWSHRHISSTTSEDLSASGNKSAQRQHEVSSISFVNFLDLLCTRAMLRRSAEAYLSSFIGRGPWIHHQSVVAQGNSRSELLLLFLDYRRKPVCPGVETITFSLWDSEPNHCFIHLK